MKDGNQKLMWGDLGRLTTVDTSYWKVGLWAELRRADSVGRLSEKQLGYRRVFLLITRASALPNPGSD